MQFAWNAGYLEYICRDLGPAFSVVVSSPSFSPFYLDLEKISHFSRFNMFPYLLLIPVIISYLVLVRVLRYQRVNEIQKQHGSTPEQFKNLNYRDAQKIIGQLGLYECPWTFLAGKDFAFLRVRTLCAEPTRLNSHTAANMTGICNPRHLQGLGWREGDGRSCRKTLC
jgi:hypothetical protein